MIEKIKEILMDPLVGSRKDVYDLTFATIDSSKDVDDITDIQIVHEEYNYNNSVLSEFIPIRWKQFFIKPEIVKEIADIEEDIKSKRDKEIIFPPIKSVFNVFYMIDLHSINVVILGQDPYFKKNEAVGVSFHVKKNNGKPINSSLLNIYKEIEREYEVKMDRKNTSLQNWLNQGVFLYNTALTVRENEQESHLKIWKIFSQHLITYISNNRKGVAFLLWGAKAQYYEKFITSSHLIIKSSHPSGMSFKSGKAPFYGSNCFKLTNDYLLAKGKKEIKWHD